MAFNLQINDPLGFIAILKRDTKMFAWFSLIFQMALSSVVSFCGVTGIALASNAATGIAVGRGLIAVAVCLSTFFASSPLTRGMMLVRPTSVAAEEIKAGEAVTTRSNK